MSNNAESPTASGEAHGSATRFTFMSNDGKYPVAANGKVQWLYDREETIRQAKSWGFHILVEMDDQGRRLGMVNLNELKSPNTPSSAMTAAQQTIELPESVARQALGAAPCSAVSVHFSSASDDWPTPQDFFDRMNALHGPLELDVCASAENAKCPRYYTREDDGLAQPWTGRCWMNPPYGRTIGLWMRKAYEESQRGALVVCLVPARTDTAWWHDYATKGQVTFIRGRLKFGGHRNSAPFPSATVVFLPNSVVSANSVCSLTPEPPRKDKSK